METPIISRKDAYARGLLMFYTGVPCRRGHVARRYTNGGACLGCAKRFQRRVNPFTKDLEPYVTERLWVPTFFTREQRIILRWYLQKCIYAFVRANNAMTTGLEVAAAQNEERPPQLENPNIND